jgi:2-amino-4-hydroxy-6-hydroxymethyldihydropteridine diphosphokinase
MGKSSKQRRDKPEKSLYAVAIGSNRPLSRALTPAAIVEAACAALDEKPLRVKARSATIATRPIGPSRRSYANAVVLLKTRLEPQALLDRLQTIEARFGRRRHQRWGARTLDLDILLWDGGCYAADSLVIPHPAFRLRDFVLAPLGRIVPRWRDPLSGLSVAHLAARLGKAKPVDRTPPRR